MKSRSIAISFVFFASAIIIFTLLQEKDMPLRMVDRATGLFAYLFIFLAILSSEYMMQMMKFFGTGFLAVHHLLARIGLSFMFIHPIAFAFEEKKCLCVCTGILSTKGFSGTCRQTGIIPDNNSSISRNIQATFFQKMEELTLFELFSLHNDLHTRMVNWNRPSYTIMKILWVSMALVVAGVFVHKNIIYYKQ